MSEHNRTVAAAFQRRTDDDYPDGPEGIYARIKDDATLAAAYLAEHDDTAADDEWIYGVTCGIKFMLKWDCGTREVFLGKESIGVKKTRGKWRELLRALGIELTEWK